MPTRNPDLLVRRVLRKLGRGRPRKPQGRWWRLKGEETLAAVRETLKIIIPVVAGWLAYQAFLKQSDQVHIQGEQLTS